MNLELLKRPVVVFAAHADDELFSIGGTIARLSKQGTKVVGVIFLLENTGCSNGEISKNVLEAKKKEVRQATGILGVHENIFLGKAPDSDIELQKQCIRLIRKYRPQMVLTHWGQDSNAQNRSVSKMVDEVCLEAGQNILSDLGKPWKVSELYYYELMELFTNPTDIVDISETIESKNKALETQKTQFNYIRGMIEYSYALAKVRGYAAGVKHAEAFLLSAVLPRRC